MKKFTKVMMVLTAVFAVAGIGFCGAGVAMGATAESVDVLREMKHKMYTLAEHSDFWDDDWDDDDWFEHSGSGYGRVERSDSGDGMAYTFAGAEELEFELRYDDLVFEPYDGTEVRMEVTGGEEGDVTVRDGDDGIEVYSRGKADGGRKIVVYYPEDSMFPFQQLSISVQEGRVAMDDLEVDELDVSVGAGAFEAEGEITAREAGFEVGTGSIRVDSLNAGKLDGECGMGEIVIGLEGTKEEWNYKLECGAGELKIDGESFTAIAGEKKVSVPGATKVMELECGMGSIQVDFED